MVNFYKSGSLFEDMVKWMEKLLQESGTVKYIDSVARMSQHSLMELQSRYREKVPYMANGYSQPVNNSQNSQNYSNTPRSSQ
jgi:hypothetical protein